MEVHEIAFVFYKPKTAFLFILNNEKQRIKTQV